MDHFSKHFPIGFGGAAISGPGKGYGFGFISDGDSEILLKTAKDRGISVFDTAPIYGFGLSEKRIGQAFSSVREEIYLITKGGVTWDSNFRVDINNSPAVIQKMLDQSLKNLRSDFIDMYMIHWPDPRVDIRAPMEILQREKERGKIKAIGLCNTNSEDLVKALEISRIDLVQSELNLFSKEAYCRIEELLMLHKISFMSWGTLDKGIISGQVSKYSSFDQFDARSWAPWWKKSNKDEKILKMEKILSYLNSKGHSGIELALAYNLSFKGVSNVLCGMKTKQQIDSALSAFNNPLPLEIFQESLNMLK